MNVERVIGLVMSNMRPLLPGEAHSSYVSFLGPRLGLIYWSRSPRSVVGLMSQPLLEIARGTFEQYAIGSCTAF